MKEGALTRLKIIAFESAEFKTEVTDGEFTIQTNPSTYSINYNIQLEEQPAIGESGTATKFQYIAPRKLNFEFLFDSTGAIPLTNLIGKEREGSRLNSVEAQIHHFERVVFKFNPERHEPNHLKLNWGSLVFNCRMESMTINYKLFDPDGWPLRATVSASFVEVKWDLERVKRDNQRSPDVTHFRVTKEGDQLTQMAENIYGDTSYYMAVAQANKLVQFRNLKMGQQILFPPIQKST